MVMTMINDQCRQIISWRDYAQLGGLEAMRLANSVHCNTSVSSQINQAQQWRIWFFMRIVCCLKLESVRLRDTVAAANLAGQVLI